MLPRAPAPVKNEGAPPILPGVKAPRPRLAGPPLAAGLGTPGEKAPVLKPTKVVATQTAHGTTAKSVPFRPLPGVFSGAPPLAKAYKDTPETPTPKAKGGGGILGAIEGIPGDVAGAAEGALKATYGIGDKAGTRQQIEAGHSAPGMATAGAINTGKLAGALPVMAKNAPGSAVRLATGIIPGAIDTAEAGGELLAGKPAKAEALGKALASMALHPLQYAEKEPASAALMLGGVESAAGTAAGDTMRSGALGDRAAELASTKRPNLQLFNDESIPREYSKDVIRKGAQVAADKFREKVLKDPDVNQATGTRLNRHVYGGGILGQALDRTGIPGLVGGHVQGLIKPGLADKMQGAFTDIRKLYMNLGDKAIHDAAKPLSKGAEEAVPLAFEGTIRSAETARTDLEGRLGELKDSAGHLTGREAKLNATQQKQITKLLANKAFLANPQPVIDAARDLATHQEPLVDRKVQVGALEPDQTHAKYVPYATRHMGAVYNLEPGPHPLVSEIATLTKTAKAADRDVSAAQAARDNAAAPNPRVPNDHPVSLAQTQVRRAELETARAEGRSADLRGPDGTRSPRFLNPAKLRGDAARARAALAKAKQDFLHEQTAKLVHTKAARDDTRGALLKAKEELGYLKDNGHIKNSGEQWPRLELNGNPLSDGDIRAHARANLGDREVGFLTHKETTYGSVTHAKTGVRPATAQISRTGEAYRTGAYDASLDALRRQFRKDGQEVAGHDSRDDVIRRIGTGSYHDPDAAAKAADNFNTTPEGERQAKGIGKMVVVHKGPDRVLNRANMPTSVATDTMRDFGVVEHKAIAELGPEGKYTLMPQSFVDRLSEHDALNNRSGVIRTAQALTNLFRSTALYSTPHWPVGITQENVIRLAFAGVNPFAVVGVGTAFKLGDALADQFRTIADDKAATEAQRFAAKAQGAAIDSGTQYGGLVANAVERTVRGQLPEGFQTFTDALSHNAPGSQVLRGWNWYKTHLGNALEKMGVNTKKALLGKIALNEAKDDTFKPFTSEWKQLVTRQDRAVKAYAEGKLTPAASAKLGDDILTAAGNYSHLTPFVRSMTQVADPFALWFLASMKFIFKTLPVNHPFKSAALAALASATGASANTHPTKSYLDGSIGINLGPLVGDVTWQNVNAEVSKYSPFGVAVEPKQTALSIFGLPVESGPVEQLLGLSTLNPEQTDLPSYEKQPSFPTRAARAGEGVLEEFVPGLRDAVTIAREGGSEDPASANPLATRPGSQKGLEEALVKEFSPVPFITSAKKTGRERPVRERPVRERAARKIRERPVRER